MESNALRDAPTAAVVNTPAPDGRVPEVANASRITPAAPPPRCPREKIAPFRDLFLLAAQRTQLPYWLLCAQAAQESDFNPRAHSAVGAIGLLQIMPQTARDCGVAPDTLWDPSANVHLGSQILAERCAAFHNEDAEERLKYGLAAYNGGMGPVVNAQALAFRNGLDPSRWANVAHALPDTWVYYNGRWHKPDFEQIIGYVDLIWTRYQAWRELQP